MEEQVGHGGYVVGGSVLGGVGALVVRAAGGVVGEQVADADAEGVDQPLEHRQGDLGVRGEVVSFDAPQGQGVDAGARRVAVLDMGKVWDGTAVRKWAEAYVLTCAGEPARNDVGSACPAGTQDLSCAYLSWSKAPMTSFSVRNSPWAFSSMPFNCVKDASTRNNSVLDSSKTLRAT